MSIIGSWFSGIAGNVMPFMKWIKIAAIAIAIAAILGLYWRASYLSGRVDDLNTQIGALNVKIESAKAANDSNIATIASLGAANKKWASDHLLDEEKITALTGKASDLAKSLSENRSQLLKLQAEDTLYDINKILEIDLASALPQLAERLRNEQRALYKDGDEGSDGSSDHQDTEPLTTAVPAVTEDSGVRAATDGEQPSS